jgi:hypothetical protein
VPDDTNGARDVFLFDRELGRLARLSGAASSSEGPSDQPHVSDDGSRVAFLSRLADPKGDGTPRQQLVLHDVPTGQSWVVSSAAGGHLGDDDSGDWGLALSGDGRCVAFASLASNLGGGRAPALYVARVPTLRRADPGDRGGAKSGL